MLKNSVFKPSVSTQKWAKAAGIRSIKTMAQTAVAVIGTGAVISAVDWKMVGIIRNCSRYRNSWLHLWQDSKK